MIFSDMTKVQLLASPYILEHGGGYSFQSNPRLNAKAYHLKI